MDGKAGSQQQRDQQPSQWSGTNKEASERADQSEELAVTGLLSSRGGLDSGQNISPRRKRKDQAGAQIRKGGKRHKVTFLDQVKKQPIA